MNNDYRYDGDTVEIEIIKKDGTRFVTLIDRVDLPRLQAIKCSLNAVTKPNTTYVRICIRRGPNDWYSRGLHAWLLNVEDDNLADHKDGNGLDNRRSSNIRITTPSGNGFNKKTSSRSTSGVRGVYPGKNGTWRVRIMQAGVRVSLGCGYPTIEAATVVARQAFRDAGAVRLPLANREMELTNPAPALNFQEARA